MLARIANREVPDQTASSVCNVYLNILAGSFEI